MTRAGVFPYRLADGTIRRELRPRSDVLSLEALDTISRSIVCNEHPANPVSRANVREVQVGHADSSARVVDGNYAAVGLTITDEQTVADAEAGKRQLSWGYTVDIEEVSGIDPEFGAYDCIQRGHRGNHIALVTHGRAGPNVRLAMDRADAEMIEDDEMTRQEIDDELRRAGLNKLPRASGAKRREAMEKTDQKDAVENLVQDALDKRDAEAKAKAAGDALQAKLDAVQEELKKLKEAQTTEPDVAVIEERIALLDSARKIVTFKDDEWALIRKQDSAGIRKGTLALMERDVSNKSDAYIEAAFDIAVEAAGDGNSLTPRADSTHGQGAAAIAANTPKRRDNNEERVQKIQAKLDDNLSKRHPMGVVSKRYAGVAN